MCVIQNIFLFEFKISHGGALGYDGYGGLQIEVGARKSPRLQMIYFMKGVTKSFLVMTKCLVFDVTIHELAKILLSLLFKKNIKSLRLIRSQRANMLSRLLFFLHRCHFVH